MSRFNTANKTTTQTINRANAPAYVQDPKMRLVSMMVTNFVKDQYYRKADESVDELVQLFDVVPPLFAAKATIYARDNFNMRSISHVAAAELALRAKGQDWYKRFFHKVALRVDDVTETLAYLTARHGENGKLKVLPHCLIKGMQLAFSKFDEYQLGKYRGRDKAVNLIDALRLAHYKPNEKQKKALDGLFKAGTKGGELTAKKTYQKELTEIGLKKDVTEEQKEELKKEVWVKQIKEKKIGYFALLRNLRNILEQSPDVLDEALESLTSDKLIASSRVLPFRFLTAIDEIKKLTGAGTRKVIKALNEAIDKSCKNVPELSGRTLIALDKSGSMEGQPKHIGSLFAAIMAKACDADVMLFADEAKSKQVNPADSTLTIAEQLRDDSLSGGTNIDTVFDLAKEKYDRVILLSDMQHWVSGQPANEGLERYKKRVGANPKVFSFDLQGYGSLQFPQENIFQMAGFSPEVFDILVLLEKDKRAMIQEIENITI